MRRSSVLTRPLSGLLTFLMVSTFLIVGTAQSVRAQSESTVLINEVSINPAGTDQPYEYIELTGTAGTSLNNLYLVVFEGDGAGSGVVDLSLNLSSYTMGSNGFLIFKASVGGHTIPAGTTVAGNSSSPAGDTRLNAGGTSPLENGTTSIVLISSPTNPIVQGTDYDASGAVNDGVLELPAGAVIQDAVGWLDTAVAGDYVYGGVALTTTGSPIFPAAATRVVGNTTPLSSSAWYGGQLTGTNADVTYGTSAATSNLPTNAVLTPGTTNYEVPPVIADLNLVGSVNSGFPGDNETVYFSFTVANEGPDATTGVAVQITLPIGIDYVSNNQSASEGGGVINWTPGSIAASSSATIIIEAITDASTGSQLTVLGQVTASNEDDDDSTPNNLGSYPVEDDEYSVMIEIGGTATCPAIGGAGPYTRIYTLQENGANYGAGGSFVIEGIVVGDYQSAGSEGMRGFYLQDETGDANSNTSDGIFVFDSTNSVAVALGDRVRVTGTVSEFNNQTQITASSIQGCGITGTITATPVALPFASATSAEIYEGMLVSFSQTLTVSEVFELGRYGQVVLSSGGRLYNPTAITTPGASALIQQSANDLNKIFLDDGATGQNPDPTPYLVDDGFGVTRRVGDTVTNLTGVLGYGNSAYRIQPVGNPPFVSANPRTGVPSVDGDVTIASFNVLNYFNGPTFPTSRGATTAEEFTRQRNKTIAAIAQMDADVVGLMEMENDVTNGSSAIEDLVAGLNAVAGAGTYDFIDTGVVGTDEIRVALIYKPASVLPLGDYVIDTDSVHSRPPLAQTFEDLSTGGIFTVVVNHFKSKGSCPGSGVDTEQGDLQGCWNATRVLQAEALAEFIDTITTDVGDTDVLIMGDLNSYAYEDPITTLVGEGYTNLIQSMLGDTAYSYVFSAQSGYLDHALASASLVSQVAEVADWHINGDEPIVLDYNMEFKSDAQDALNLGTPYRASDHDPVMIGLDLTSDVDATVSVSPTTDSDTEASAGTIDVTVTLDLENANGLTTQAVSGSVMLSGTALENSDYTISSTSFSFPAGSSDGDTQTVQLTISDDSLVEADETVVVTVNGATNATIGTADTSTFTINDDETATVSFSSSTNTAGEDAGSVNAAVVLNLTWTDTAAGSLQDAVNVSVTADGTSTASASDYSLNGVSFAAGTGDDATQNATITIVDDIIDENDETVVLSLGITSGEATADTGMHTLTITDNDTQTATVQFSSAGTSTTDESGTAHNIDVVLTTSDAQPLINAITVDVSDLGTGSATATTDYTFSTTTLTFAASAANSSTQSAAVTVVSDSDIETNETVNLGLGNLTGTNASLGSQTSYTLTITEDDFPPQTATVQFSTAISSSVNEAGTTYNVGVTLTTSDGQPLVNALSVDVSDLGTGSATATTDYSFSTSTLTFGVSATSGSQQVAVIGVVSDTEDESDETVNLGLGNLTGTGASLGAQTSHTFTITDDDAPAQTATVEFSSASATTTDEAGTSYNVEVKLTTSDGQPLVNAITVDVSDLGTGSATATTDYNFSTTTLTFAASATNGSTQNAAIAVVSDTDDESNETVNLVLGNLTGTNASLGAQTGYVFTITDDDTAATPGVTLSRTSLSARPGGVRTYTVVLNTQPTANVVIAISQPARCIVRPRTLTFTPSNWNTPQTVKVTVRANPFPGTRCVIRHTATGGGYDGVVINRVVLTIIRPR